MQQWSKSSMSRSARGFASRSIGRCRRRRAPMHPGFFWLGGFRSDMTGTKASRLTELAQADRPAVHPFRLFRSWRSRAGDFEDGTISDGSTRRGRCSNSTQDWPMILIGSSMGGYLALLLARRSRSSRATASRESCSWRPRADMTEALMWQTCRDAGAREAIAQDGVWYAPQAYGEPYPITRKLIEDGRKHLLLDGRSRSRLPGAHSAWRCRRRCPVAARTQDLQAIARRTMSSSR